MAQDLTRIIEQATRKYDGVLRLRPCWVARNFLRPGKRLGLPEDAYDLGRRGFICERWFGSETNADNEVKVENEGLSYLNIDGAGVLLRDAVASCKSIIMGEEYAATHKDLGRLAKVFDYDTRLFYHVHQPEHEARKVGRNSKEEAYFFPEGVPLGPHPETFFGVHPYIVERGKQEEVFLPYLERWEGDEILMHARAYLNVRGEGFHIPAGILHAPGTALTIELQEPSDVMAVLQANVEGFPISKHLLSKDVSTDEWEASGEKAVLDQIDWELNADPYFYENRHTPPVLVAGSEQDGGYEEWIYYNTTKFSGKRLIVYPGKRYVSKDKGVYNLVVWRGSGTIQGREVAAGHFEIDELLVTHERAVSGVEFVNEGEREMEVIKFFGPDVNNEVVPFLPKYPS